MSLFGGSQKIDHPLGDAKEAQDLANEIRQESSESALNQATGLIESMLGIDEFDFETLTNRLFLLDDAAMKHTFSMVGEYLDLDDKDSMTEDRYRRASLSYYTILAETYFSCFSMLKEMSRPPADFDVGELGSRLVSACYGLLLWSSLKYGPIPKEVWYWSAVAYSIVDTSGNARTTAPIHDGKVTSTEAEYIKLIIFATSNPDSLKRKDVAILGGLMGSFVRFFRLSDTCPPSKRTYFVDLASGSAPVKLMDNGQLPSVPVKFLFASDNFIDNLNEIRISLREKKMPPPSFTFGSKKITPRPVIAILNSIEQHWKSESTDRRSPRHSKEGTVRLLFSFREISDFLLSKGNYEGQSESSSIVDASSTGMKLSLSYLSTKVEVGSLIGIYPQSSLDEIWVGSVRRVQHLEEKNSLLGIQLLSKAPALFVSTYQSKVLEGIFLGVSPSRTQMVRVLLRRKDWNSTQQLEIASNQMQLLFQPQGIIEEIQDCCIAGYTLVAR